MAWLACIDCSLTWQEWLAGKWHDWLCGCTAGWPGPGPAEPKPIGTKAHSASIKQKQAPRTADGSMHVTAARTKGRAIWVPASAKAVQIHPYLRILAHSARAIEQVTAICWPHSSTNICAIAVSAHLVTRHQPRCRTCPPAALQGSGTNG
jgi:hypothetical protein